MFVFIETCPLLGGNFKKIVIVGSKCLTAINGMSAIWDARYWEFSLCKETDSRVIQPSAPNILTSVSSRVLFFFTYFSDQNKEFYSLIVKL